MDTRIYRVTVTIAVPFYGLKSEDSLSGMDYIEAAQEAAILDMNEVRLQLALDGRVVPYQGKQGS
jgi:hypothetical protein